MGMWVWKFTLTRQRSLLISIGESALMALIIILPQILSKIVNPIRNWLTCILCFMYEVANENGAAAQKMYIERFAEKHLLNSQTFESIHWELYVSESFYASKCDVGSGIYHRIPAVEESVLRTVEDTIATRTRLLNMHWLGGVQPFGGLYMKRKCTRIICRECNY